MEGMRRRRRPNRPAAARRAQEQRAQARAVQHLLDGFAQLMAHRGCRPTRLGAALYQALSQTSPDQPDWDDVEGDDDADVELPDFAKMTLEQARQRCQAEAAAAAGTDGHMDGLDASTVPVRSAKAVQVEELKAEIQGAAGAAQADDAAPPPSTEVNTEDPTAAVIEGGVEAAEGQLECDADEELKMEDPMAAKTKELNVQPIKDRGVVHLHCWPRLETHRGSWRVHARHLWRERPRQVLFPRLPPV